MPRLNYLPQIAILTLAISLLFLVYLNLQARNQNPRDPQSINQLEVTATKPSASPLNDELSPIHARYLLGQHFIFGSDDFAVLSNLVEQGAIGGVFLSQKYVGQKTLTRLKFEIASLQTIQAINHLPPLFITTDQEGGLIERLSPPLIKRVGLTTLFDHSRCSEIPNSCLTQVERDSIRQYGVDQGSDLNSLGVNLNFAPVLDIYQQVKVPGDRQTLLHKRALGEHPWLVSEVAKHYVAGLNQANVLATFKHFPGLGSATKDTHQANVHLTKSFTDLKAYDLVPFMTHLTNKPNAIMLSHAIIDSLDPTTPSSLSKKVITQVIREQLNYTGLLITDDFSMYPISASPQGSELSAIIALNSGVDLILVTNETEEFLDILNTTVDAYNQNTLDHDMLLKSRERLVQARLWTQNHRSN